MFDWKIILFFSFGFLVLLSVSILIWYSLKLLRKDFVVKYTLDTLLKENELYMKEFAGRVEKEIEEGNCTISDEAFDKIKETSEILKWKNVN